LANDYAETTFWTAEAPAPPRAAMPLPASADVVIVGGGYCGLAAATELATRGHDAVLIEREALGWGASSRNGGMVIPELKVGPVGLQRRYGALGTRLHQAVNDAFDDVERIIATTPIDCEYERTGQLYLAHHLRVVDHLRHEADELAEVGEPAHFVSREELATEIGSTAYHAGLVFDRTGGLQPARFHQGLVRRADAAGAGLHEHTAATLVERRGDGFRVTTDRGIIEARDLIVATNAYADGLIPPLRRKTLPVGSYIIATEPLDADVAAAVNPNRRMFVDTKNFLFYWRLTADRRMIFGGRRSLSPVSVPEARDFLYGSMVRIHPQLDGARVTNAWGGNVAITFDRMPQVGVIDGAHYATGCNGSGVALNTWLGSQVAGMVLGDEPPPFAALKRPAIPLWRWRSAYLPVVGQWYRYRDGRP
jgi:glycine/D-amino acid oxidase-like deaminating enzyme